MQKWLCPCPVIDARGARAAANMQKLAAAREAHVGEVEYELRVAREDVAELRARLGRQQEERCGGGAAPDPSPAAAGGGRRGDEAGSGAAQGAGREGDAGEEQAPGMASLAHAPGSGGGDGALSMRCAWARLSSPATGAESTGGSNVSDCAPWLAGCLAYCKLPTRTAPSVLCRSLLSWVRAPERAQASTAMVQ